VSSNELKFSARLGCETGLIIVFVFNVTCKLISVREWKRAISGINDAKKEFFWVLFLSFELSYIFKTTKLSQKKYS
jgi:hypothetical protein